MLGKILHILFYSCLKATELMEKSFHVELNFIEKFRLDVHRKMCSACTRYEKQSLLLEKNLELKELKELNLKDVELLKEKIIKRLEDSEKK